MKSLILKGRVITSDGVLPGGAVLVEGERIAGVFADGGRSFGPAVETRDFGTAYISPGLIDVHLHGALGGDVMDGDPESLRRISLHQSRNGVTGFAPATLTASLDDTVRAAAAVRAAAGEALPSEILGLHYEGPFLNVGKKGAQNPAHILEITAERVDRLLAAAEGLPVLLTMAPEPGRNAAFIADLRRQGVVLSIGHTEATYDQALTAFDAGIRHATHLYNAMSGFQPRVPGVMGAVLDDPRVTAELIADGIHVHPASLRLAVRVKGPGRVCLITDSLTSAGLGDGDYRMGGLDIVVKGPEARLREGGALAGSILTLNRAVANIVAWTGVTVSDAIRMASLTPARELGLDAVRGSIAAGKFADLAVFDADFNALETFVRGRSMYRNAA
jgi:N-acetylglucosamine-6-phosphate deacetylase